MPASSVHDISTSSSNNAQRRHLSGTGHGEHVGPVKTDFLCRVKYGNTLPDIPFEAKFLACPFVSLNRFIEYKPTTLEKNFKWELLTEPDLGVSIDLINPDTYYVDNEGGRKQHDPTDSMLLEDEQANPQNSRRSMQHSKIVPWMRKTEYISSEFQRFGVAADRQETKVGYSVKKKFQNEVLYRDRASQIAAINKTFDEVNKPRHQHPTKKGVTAVTEYSLLPDYENWMHPFALVVFDGDPLPQNEKDDPNTLMSQALIRGMMDEEGEQFVTYFLPTKETLEMRVKDIEEGREYTPDYSYEYYSVRDYNWLVRNKATKGFEQDNYLFSFRENGAFYNELETRVSLSRRKAKRVRQNTKLFVHNRDYEDSEIAAQHERLNRLLHPYDDEKDDEGSYKSSDEGDGNDGEEEKQKQEEENSDESGHEEENSSDESSNEEEKEERDDEEKTSEEGSDGEEKNSEKSDSSESD